MNKGSVRPQRWEPIDASGQYAFVGARVCETIIDDGNDLCYDDDVAVAFHCQCFKMNYS